MQDEDMMKTYKTYIQYIVYASIQLFISDIKWTGNFLSKELTFPHMGKKTIKIHVMGLRGWCAVKNFYAIEKIVLMFLLHQFGKMCFFMKGCDVNHRASLNLIIFFR